MPWSINAGNKFYNYTEYKWFTTTTDAGGMPVMDAILYPNSASLYIGINYEGDQLRLDAGDYTNADLQALGFVQVNSIMVPFDFKVTIFTDGDLTGASQVYTSTTADLQNINAHSIKVEYLDSY